MALILRSVARSDVGLVREGNEDSGYAGPRLLAVADGMGGHAAGEVASSATIDELVHVENGVGERDALETLNAAVVAANDRIRQLVLDDPRREGMGTTLTALLWTGADIRLAHIGDSRAYLLRDGELRQLTHDHTFVQTLVDEGRISASEANIHPARSLILKALDGKPDPEPDLDVLEVRPGDRLLVCSDGLSGVVSNETLRDTLMSRRDLGQAADALVELAMRGGAPDNVTVVVADVVETASPPASDDTAEAYLVGAASGGEDPPVRSGRRRPSTAVRSLLGSSGAARAEPDTDPEELRYAPQPPRRFRWLRRLALVLAVAGLVWVGARLAEDWLRTQYYVGELSGHVAIFQGVSQEIGPVTLSRAHEPVEGLPVGALPDVYREQVSNTITADNYSEAMGIVENLRSAACAAHAVQEPPTTEPQTGTDAGGATNEATGTEGSTARVGAGVAPTEQPTQAPTPTPTPRPLPTAPPGYPGLECPEGS
ncbi:MAG TPA: PP2C family serine/threonine-protein phosphatase [Jiangellaceae bacterium]|nr:PP2C family serine/threonine-protein phosphatase [Jiangellaceae bacterium]